VEVRHRSGLVSGQNAGEYQQRGADRVGGVREIAVAQVVDRGQRVAGTPTEVTDRGRDHRAHPLKRGTQACRVEHVPGPDHDPTRPKPFGVSAVTDQGPHGDATGRQGVNDASAEIAGAADHEHRFRVGHLRFP